MTTDSESTEEEIAEEVLPESFEAPAVPIKLDRLFPWHKPRKQYVRQRQWVEFSRRLLQRLSAQKRLPLGEDGKPEVRYLTLPGTDFLDVRLLAEVCADLGCQLTSTGFLAVAEGNQVLARAQVRQESLIKGGYISDRSQTFWRQLEDIASHRSHAHVELRNRCPFQIINIDACGSVALPNAERAHRVVDAIYRIVEMQFSRSISPWLLFLTADVRRENLDTETLAKICDALRQNARESEDFAKSACALVAPEEVAIDQAIYVASQDQGVKFIHLFALSIAKWLLHLANGKGWGMKMHSSFFYSSAPHPATRPTMPCLAFEFVPPAEGLVDPFGVANAGPAPGGSHADHSMRAIEKVQQMVNLDELLGKNKDLTVELVDATQRLLEEAGYTAGAIASLRELAGLEPTA